MRAEDNVFLNVRGFRGYQLVCTTETRAEKLLKHCVNTLPIWPIYVCTG